MRFFLVASAALKATRATLAVASCSRRSCVKASCRRCRHPIGQRRQRRLRGRRRAIRRHSGSLHRAHDQRHAVAAARGDGEEAAGGARRIQLSQRMENAGAGGEGWARQHAERGRLAGVIGSVGGGVGEGAGKALEGPGGDKAGAQGLPMKARAARADSSSRGASGRLAARERHRASGRPAAAAEAARSAAPGGGQEGLPGVRRPPRR